MKTSLIQILEPGSERVGKRRNLNLTSLDQTVNEARSDAFLIVKLVRVDILANILH